MSEQIDDGGVAFPVHTDSDFNGMSLRDYFAAKAMNGLLAQSCGTAAGSDPKYAADYAYATADAMIAAREAKS